MCGSRMAATFFERNGLLFLPPAELQDMSDKLVAAQPLIGSMARDPSLRGLFDALTLFVEGAGGTARRSTSWTRP